MIHDLQEEKDDYTSGILFYNNIGQKLELETAMALPLLTSLVRNFQIRNCLVATKTSFLIKSMTS